ncbi:IS110 family transposase [Mesorhizobium sp. M0621]|uniref:hypothetical protein n=1 Tax=Mesorhizobium sp. M0621 TaxID=2956974 RepID=UPI003339A3B8
MEQFLGLDVSVLTTSVCVMDTAGKLIREGKVETELEAIGALFAIGGLYKRVGLEAGPFSQWLNSVPQTKCAGRPEGVWWRRP